MGRGQASGQSMVSGVSEADTTHTLSRPGRTSDSARTLVTTVALIRTLRVRAVTISVSGDLACQR